MAGLSHGPVAAAKRGHNFDAVLQLTLPASSRHSPDMTAVALPLTSVLRRAAGTALDAVLPPLCLACRVEVEEAGALCGACWSRIAFLAPPLCAACGFPFDYDPGGSALCGACLRRPPDYGRARAVMRYDEASRALVLGFKHGDRTHGAAAYGRWMARAGAELLGEADLVAPVPLHWLRLFRRRYNQAALLAQAVARTAGLPVAVDLLARRRATPSQGHLGAAARRRNVRGAFAVRPRWAARIPGQRIVIVDDVLTTGATAEACARTLLRAGAAAVDVLVLARVVRGAPEPAS
jgi:ComF family protein